MMATANEQNNVSKPTFCREAHWETGTSVVISFYGSEASTDRLMHGIDWQGAQM